ncbi:hypothetical protein QZH41_000544 [Actinostola sp. cb2023]|nr:hypothetical protein QZH41_000544 [Actinostola sp. cb2023]
MASETELEDLLTKYTKLNKSASVFLGGPPDKPRDDDNKTFSYVETGLNRRKEAETTLLRAHLRSASAAQLDNNWTNPRESSFDTNVSMAERHSRYISAVTAYGKSLALNKTKTRPASAKIISSSSQDERQMAANEHAVAVALQRLAKRQSARQYSPAQALTSTTSTNWRDILKQLDTDGIPEGSTDDRYVSLVNHVSKRDGDEARAHHVRNDPKSRDRHVSANATFNSFVDFDPDELTGLDIETAMRQHANSHPSTWRSIRVDLPRQYDNTLVDREEKDKNEPLELKKPISREDYNRHMRLLNQKLVDEKFPFDHVLPRPPPGPSPGRKHISAKRIARVR